MTKEVKFDVQTEGLGEFWGVAPNYHERRTRDPMSADELLEIILTILDENGEEATGLFIIEYANRSVHVRLNSGKLELSDPNNANYQNVAIRTEDFKPCLTDVFKLRNDGKEVQNYRILLLEWIIALVAGSGMVVSFYFAFQFLNRDVEFMPMPEFMEVGDQEDFDQHLRDLAGVYFTRLEDGQTLLNITRDGHWGFYDISQAAGRNFDLVKVEEGLCRPVYQKGRLALLTDSNHLFLWESDGILVFQDRRYFRSASTAKELSNVRFPDNP